jgi:serine phosphatase RsbU (regulator of sigma subunit)
LNQNSHIADGVVKQEFDRSTEKFQVITAWVGIALNLIWFISDYIVIPEYLVSFLIFRICVSVVATLALLFRKKIGISIYYCMFILVVGISMQNAYMWTLMDLAHFQKHAFAYIVLFIGVGMLVLWELKLSILIAVITIIVNLILFYFNSPLSFKEFMVNGTLITFTVGIFSIFMIRTRYRLIYNDIRIRLELEYSNKIIEQKHKEVVKQKLEIQSQKDSLEHKNKEITDSINYAERIQRSFMATKELLDENLNHRSRHAELPETSSGQVVSASATETLKQSRLLSGQGDEDSYFVFFQPKDVVSGDFYWGAKLNNANFILATADSTGHGVPGAIMSLLNISSLEKSIENETEPADILNSTRKIIIDRLKKDGSEHGGKDGMDCSLISFDFNNSKITYAAANNPIWIVRENVLLEFAPDKMPVGKHDKDSISFTQHEVEIQKGDIIYAFTDGMPDQFGGPRGKKFMHKALKELIVDISIKPMAEQKELLQSALNNWMGDNEQVDDVCVIGVCV